MDDEVLSEGFERLVRVAGGRAPSMAELEGRVARRRERRRRNRQRLQLAAVAVVVAVVGLATLLLDRRDEASVRVTSNEGATTSVPAPIPDPAFTLGGVPAGLAFRSCTALEPTASGDVGGVTCSFEDPGSPGADGVRVTRVIGALTPELQEAWDAGDAPAAVAASGGSDAPGAAAFTTLGDRTVLDLSPGGRPSSAASAALRVLVGGDLVDIGSTNVPVDDLGRIVSSLGQEEPSSVVAAALGALPEGSSVLVQGERPLWVVPDPLEPEARAPFGGTTVGAELAVPGGEQLVGIDVTTDIDAEAFLDALLADGDPALTEVAIGGRRALVLDPAGMLPVTVPEPRAGPQVLVATDARTLVRVKQPDGSADLVRSVAEALR